MFFMGNGYMSSDCGLMGGYPAATGYRFEAHKTDIKERIAQQLPIPTGGDMDPDQPDYERNFSAEEIIRDKQAITSEAIFEEYDLYLNYLRGGPGFGDPIERLPQHIAEDLNEGLLLPRFAESVYGAIVERDEKGIYTVNATLTAQRRTEIRKERLTRGRTVSAWQADEKTKILAKDASLQVRHMYASSFALSPAFIGEFKEFWQLPEAWDLTEAELEMPVFGVKINNRTNP
jgi:acetone carboxylase alpha subunit